jgi:hypothetical protein
MFLQWVGKFEVESWYLHACRVTDRRMITLCGMPVLVTRDWNLTPAIARPRGLGLATNHPEERVLPCNTCRWMAEKEN